MNEELVQLYQNELTDLREKGVAFAEANPKIASRLKLAKGSVEDPLVGRLLESFAFLTARLRYQVQAEFKQLDHQLAQLLYPHFFLPLPSFSTLQFTASKELSKPNLIPENTGVTTPLPNQLPCTYSLVYPVTVRPLQLTQLRYQREPIVAPQKTISAQIKSCLTFTLETSHDKANLQTLFADPLRLFLNLDMQYTGRAYELLAGHLKEVLVRDDVQVKAVNVPVQNFRTVGFSEAEQALPYPKNSFAGYRLLTEYFAYPDKFNYFDLCQLNEYIAPSAQRTLTFYLFFDAYYSELELGFNADSLLLNCAPVINLFPTTGETIKFDQSRHDFQIIPAGIPEPEMSEVYMVQALNISSGEHIDEVDCLPYFGRRQLADKDYYLYWNAQRKSCAELGQMNLMGDEVFVSMTNMNLPPMATEFQLTPVLLCSNRNAPSHLPFGGGKPVWTVQGVLAHGTATVQCVRPITEAKYRPNTQQIRAELMRHMYINQVGLTDSAYTFEMLKSILALYCFGEAQGQALVEQGIWSVATQAVTLRHPDSLHQGFCRGIEYQIVLDETVFAYHNVYLFGRIIYEFLIRSCSINSFIKLTLSSKQRGVIQEWQPKLGTKNTL